MKFTNGYWQTRAEFVPLYAIEYAAHEICGEELVIYAPGKHIEDRGDCLNQGMLTISFSSPAEDVIGISVTHFAGTKERGPRVQINEESKKIRIIENDNTLEYISGRTKAVIDKRPGAWKVTFYDNNRILTESGFRNTAYMKRNDGNGYIVQQLALDVGELVYGFGERFTPFVKNGQTIEIWNEDGGTSSEIAYKNIPFYLSNKGYGVLVDELGDISFEVASEKVEYVQFSSQGEKLSYYIVNGGLPKQTIQKYTALTGRPALPPPWSFGLWLSTSFTTEYDEKTISALIEGMEERKIPLHVFHFDCYWMEAYEWCNFTWDRKVFPNPEEMLQRYHERGLKICVWINPYIGQKSVLFREGVEKGYFIKKRDGNVWQTDMWQAGMAVVDFTNPEAAIWYRGHLEKLLDMGIDCFKTDFGERIPVKDIVYYDGSDPVRMHNYYTYLYNQMVFNLLLEKRGMGEAVVFARSATVGGQKFPVHWGGDSTATYLSMAETLRGGLSLACCGFGFWSHDIGGFENKASADVYKRWCAFGLLSSHSRLHGSTSYRVPWLFDEEASKILRRFVNLKCRLMPYLYHYAVEAHRIGIPMMRPMFLEFPEDRNCEALDRQYMLGEALLVAPVFKENGEVEYYLPHGTWTHLLDGRCICGGRWIKEIYDYMSLPLFIRPNSVVAIGKNEQEVVYDYQEEVTLYISELDENKKISTWVPTSTGEENIEVIVEREGKHITITIIGLDKDSWNYKLVGRQKIGCEVTVKRR